tara:strand:+ start:407 stop:583 length:177 start_codon:yes stop_codon:yes gene_type:complete
MPAFGIDPIRVGVRPLYRERNPVDFTVWVKPDIIPLYGRGFVADLSCSCVFINSIGLS